MSLICTTPPAVEPVTLSEMKLQCGFSPYEDTDIVREQILAEQLRSKITAARVSLEEELGRAFITQQWTMTLDRFPFYGSEYLVRGALDIILPRPMLKAINSFTYLDTSGTLQNMLQPGSWGYQVTGTLGDSPAMLRPPAFLGWPLTQLDTSDTVTIVFTCGFGDTPATVPMPIRDAIKLRAKFLFEGANGPEPAAIRSLVGTYQDLNN